MNSRMHKPFLTHGPETESNHDTETKAKLPKHLHIQPVPLPKQEKK